MTLAELGNKKIKWAAREMPVLVALKDKFSKSKPLAGKKVVACMHVTAETANLMDVISSWGAEVKLCASNPLSTQNEIVAALNAFYDNVKCYSEYNETVTQYYDNISKALDIEPHFVLDDGCDLVNFIYTKRQYLLKNIIGGTEETTTGVQRLKAMENDGMLSYPIICVNDALTKHIFDNQYGTGQSTLDGIIRATNTLLAGKTFVIAGYGWCGKGLAQKAKGLGCKVIVTEIDAIKALQAHMDGFEVMTMHEACKIADYIVTVTGNKNVLTQSHFEVIKNNAIIANSGHFDVEIDIEALKQISSTINSIRPNLEEYVFESFNEHKRVYVLGQGRLVNLACAEGHPSCVMDMSFANQAMSVKYLAENKLENKLHPVPVEIDEMIAEMKLDSLNIQIDKLNEEQINYLNSWSEGT